MTSIHTVINDDDVTSISETSRLLVQPQQTTAVIPIHRPRHSISWVKFYIKLFKKNYFDFSRIFLEDGVKLLDWIYLLLPVLNHL
jgi:hypothetical protein